MEIINLFEYENTTHFNGSLDELEKFLDEIWKNREVNEWFLDHNNISKSQRFLKIFHKTSELKSNKYVGVIHFEGKRINLLPKIFYKNDNNINDDGISFIQNHILWWLSYCNKIKFPNYQTTIGGQKNDFFEILIYLFSKYTRELLNSSIYQQYEDVNRDIHYVKGRINTHSYINNISHGNFHKINCNFDLFVFDNQFNRIIKYVSKLLFQVTNNKENKTLLREILFVMDEVSDERCSAKQCSRILFNSVFSHYEIVRDYCQLFLNYCISFDYKNDLKLFAFLLPMDTIFEDFIYGFINKEIDDLKVSRKQDKFLDEKRKVFKLKPDIWIENRENRIFIADAKYKIIFDDSIYNEKNHNDDKSNGIDQKDLYQMLAYAVRYEVENIILFYPNLYRQINKLNKHNITISDALAGKEVLIDAYQLPIISNKLKFDKSISLDKNFLSTKLLLKNKLEDIFN